MTPDSNGIAGGVGKMLEAVHVLGEWLGFSASCIKSGEAWSPTCEAMRQSARDALTTLSRLATIRDLTADTGESITGTAAEMPTICEDPAGKGYPCFERPMTAREACDALAAADARVDELEAALEQIELQSTNIAGDFDDDPWRFAQALGNIARHALKDHSR